MPKTTSAPDAHAHSSSGTIPDSPVQRKKSVRVVELFAGVGGFHVGLERSGWHVIWANQYEPSTKRMQHAWEVYRRRFPKLAKDMVSCEDINVLTDNVRANIPEHDLLVGGFPCQDYSVAKPLPKAKGLGGKKGVLWWNIFEILQAWRPPLVLLENVDRLLSSPASHRGRDFAIMLACFDSLGYSVDWRIITADDYGFPQRRRRVFIVARREAPIGESALWSHVTATGILARTFKIDPIQQTSAGTDNLPGRPDAFPSPDEVDAFDRVVRKWIFDEVERWDDLKNSRSKFQNAGVMSNGRFVTLHAKAAPGQCLNLTPHGNARPATLGEIVSATRAVDAGFLVPRAEKPRWEAHKGAKALSRRGGDYFYSEGGMSCPDNRSRSSRTIITSEGGATPSRFKHVIAINPDRDRLSHVVVEGRRVPYEAFLDAHGDKYRTDQDREVWRRLTPEELEALNGFERGWTDVLLSDGSRVPDSRRAFLMGNALVVGIVEAIGRTLMDEWQG